MRVLHVMNKLMPSGAEIMLKVAAQAFQSNNIESHILETSKEAGNFGGILAKEGYKIQRQYLSKNIITYIKLYKLFRLNKYDCVHIHSEGKRFPVAILAMLARVPKIIATVHNVFEYDGSRRILEIFKRRILSAGKVVYVSIGDSVEKNERQLLINPTIRINNWFDSARFSVYSDQKRVAARDAIGITEDQILILTVGNCSEIKNHSLLLKSLASIDSSKFNWIYYHIGSGECENDEKELAGRLGIFDRCVFMGTVNDVESILPIADLYVMPSKKEGASIAVLEALACGVPTVLANVPGLSDVSKYSVYTRYSKLIESDLKETIIELLQTNSFERRKNAIETAEFIRSHFSPQTGASAYSDLYKK